MDDAVQQDWPNQRNKILATTTTLTVLATIFLFWRCIYGLQKRGSFLVCDYLLVVSWVSYVYIVLLSVTKLTLWIVPLSCQHRYTIHSL